ncbi:MAG: DinB family protein [Acidimicrobiia bacterium]|nr:DinB family protein [Acidimicrobiia bacterium]
MPDVSSLVRIQLVRELEGLVREIEAFPDDASVWAVVPGVTNSAGTLAQHVCGNLQHFVGRVLGGSSYVRERDREFSERTASRATLVAELRKTAEVVADALTRLPIAQLDAAYPEQLGGYTVNTAQFLVHLSAHLAFHLGQAGYLRRIATGSNTSVGPLPLASIAS